MCSGKSNIICIIADATPDKIDRYQPSVNNIIKGTYTHNASHALVNRTRCVHCVRLDFQFAKQFVYVAGFSSFSLELHCVRPWVFIHSFRLHLKCKNTKRRPVYVCEAAFDMISLRNTWKFLEYCWRSKWQSVGTTVEYSCFTDSTQCSHFNHITRFICLWIQLIWYKCWIYRLLFTHSCMYIYYGCCFSLRMFVALFHLWGCFQELNKLICFDFQSAYLYKSIHVKCKRSPNKLPNCGIQRNRWRRGSTLQLRSMKRFTWIL